ncbi:universal stress protein [Cupriavidus sp. YR651]|uniref:universal stress protein n=1 Tax=Cupriavidus sp. YR651 TaxID=1855315 RepID=UPI0021016CAD|nr:universal stress protein [Cupriavidus sp. YR651]
MRETATTIDDRMRACAYLFWFESYLGAPVFPLSDGLVPLDAALRQRYIAHQSRCQARWLARARRLGGSADAFRSACVAVRASLFGCHDILMHIRGLASAISEPALQPITTRLDMDIGPSFPKTLDKKPSMPRKILVAVDNSRCASRALDEAVREAALRHAHLEILHVVNYSFLKNQENPFELAAIRRQHVTEANALLQEAAGRAQAAQIEHSEQLVDNMATLGDVADRIVQYARDSRPDLVVAGTHGHTGLSRAVLGSVAEKLVRHCPAPVLVIREDMAESGDAGIPDLPQTEVVSK